MIRLIAIAALPLLLATAAQAGEADGIDCKNAVAQQEMNICADKDFQAADGQLNAVYKKTMADLDDHSRDLLRAAQREWVKFRDAECTYLSAQNEGGSIYPMVYSGCLTTLTRERIKQLKAGQS